MWGDHSSEDGWIKMLETFVSELLHLGLLNASQSVLPAGSQLAEARSRICRSHCIYSPEGPPTCLKCCCPAVSSAQGKSCREPGRVLAMAVALSDSGLGMENHRMVCSAATLQNQITTFQSSDLVLLHPTRYKIIPLCSQKTTLPFSFNTGVPLTSCQQRQKILLSRTSKKYPSK